MVEATSCGGVVIYRGKILTLYKSYKNRYEGWVLPKGTVEEGEEYHETALREVKEESGLDVTIKDIIGTYTDPNIRVAYSDGEVRQEFTIVYYGEASNYDVSIDDESSQFKWVALDKILDLPLAESQRRRINDVLEFLKSGKRNLM